MLPLAPGTQQRPGLPGRGGEGALLPDPPNPCSLLGKPRFFHRAESLPGTKRGKNPPKHLTPLPRYPLHAPDQIQGAQRPGDAPPSPAGDAAPVPLLGSPALAFPLFQEPGISPDPYVFPVSINPEPPLGCRSDPADGTGKLRQGRGRCLRGEDAAGPGTGSRAHPMPAAPRPRAARLTSAATRQRRCRERRRRARGRANLGRPKQSEALPLPFPQPPPAPLGLGGKRGAEVGGARLRGACGRDAGDILAARSHVDPAPRARPPVYAPTHPRRAGGPRAGGPRRVPAGPMPADTPELSAAPNFAGVGSWAWTHGSAGRSAGVSGGLQPPLPGHAGLQAPPVTTALAAVTQVTDGRGAFSGTSPERRPAPELSRAMTRTRTPAGPQRPGDEGTHPAGGWGRAGRRGCGARRDPVLDRGDPVLDWEVLCWTGGLHTGLGGPRARLGEPHVGLEGPCAALGEPVLDWRDPMLDWGAACWSAGPRVGLGDPVLDWRDPVLHWGAACWTGGPCVGLEGPVPD